MRSPKRRSQAARLHLAPQQQPSASFAALGQPPRTAPPALRANRSRPARADACTLPLAPALLEGLEGLCNGAPKTPKDGYRLGLRAA